MIKEKILTKAKPAPAKSQTKNRVKSQAGKRISIYNIKGEKKGTLLLPKIFEYPEKPELVHRVVVWQQLNAKPSTGHTKTRGERRGGGRKPWRQKGTGRARVGSIRSPLWRKGGVTFGPTPAKNFKIRLPKKIRRLALFSTLSSKANQKNLIVLDKLEVSQPKTKIFEGIIADLKLLGTILLVLEAKNDKIQRAARNLPYLKILPVNSLNVLDLLKYQYLLTTKAGIEKINQIYSFKES